MKKLFLLAGSRFLVLGSLFLITNIAQAAVSVPKPPTGNLPTSPVQNTTDIQNLACGLLPWIFWGLIVLAIIMALVAAYRYATAAGEPEKVGNASKTLLWAAVAVAVAIIAQGIPYIVGSFFTSGGAGFNSACSSSGGSASGFPGLPLGN